MAKDDTSPAPKIVNPEPWPRPSGYSHGILAAGRILNVSGQIGGIPPKMTLATGFSAQFSQALDNVLSVLAAAGAQPRDLTALNIYVLSLDVYRSATKDLRNIWKQSLGDHYPAVTLLEVSGLLEPGALVEIQGQAIIPN